MILKNPAPKKAGFFYVGWLISCGGIVMYLPVFFFS